jgi:putative ABC transport system permease protein
MFAYYAWLGLRSLRRNPFLTALMVLTLAVGVAASVSTLTILHMLSGDPIPSKSSRLLVPQLDNGPLTGWKPGDPPDDPQMSYQDAANLLRSGQGVRRSAMFAVALPVEPPRPDLAPFNAEGLAPSRDFFAMFDVPFLRGQAWSSADDAAGADVVVLGRAAAERLFGAVDPVGRRIRLRGTPYTVTGVTDTWAPRPRYYKLLGGDPFGDGEDFFIPFSNAIRHEMNHNGGMSCSAKREPGYAALLASECTWIQFWFELPAASDRADLRTYLQNYTAAQRKLGRMQRPAPAALYDVMEWMEKNKVVGNDVRLSTWLAFGFLLLCLVNTVGLLLAKFSVRAPEIGVRRALGASRADIVRQFTIETAIVGLAGGALGLLLAFGALALIGMQNSGMAAIAHMDWQMLLLTFAIGIAASLVAGLVPTLRACRVRPALQLKSQ